MKWQYKTTVAGNHSSFVTEACVLGDDGWELVHVEYVSAGFVIGFFKRPLTESKKK